MSFVLLAYTGESVATTFMVTAGMFGALAMYGTVTKRNLAGLGQFLFELPNRFDVYLHDTPSKHLFSRDGRRFSHGCIRVDNAAQLAAFLMEQPLEAINETIATGDTIRSAVPKPVPVFVVYQTAFAEFDGRLQFRPDIYGRDAEIAQYLNRKRPAVAER